MQSIVCLSRCVTRCTGHMQRQCVLTTRDGRSRARSPSFWPSRILIPFRRSKRLPRSTTAQASRPVSHRPTASSGFLLALPLPSRPQRRLRQHRQLVPPPPPPPRKQHLPKRRKSPRNTPPPTTKRLPNPRPKRSANTTKLASHSADALCANVD